MKVIVKSKILWTLQIVCSYKILFRFFSLCFFFSICRYCASWPRESLNSLQPFSFPDVRTQAMYQLLDTGFIGLIFSCFSEDAQKVRVYRKLFIFVWTFSRLFWNELLSQVGRIQVIAFQSLDGKQSRTPKPIPLSPVNKSSFIDLESSLSSSENASTRGEILEQDTCDSKSAVAIKVQVLFSPISLVIWAILPFLFFAVESEFSKNRFWWKKTGLVCA